MNRRKFFGIFGIFGLSPLMLACSKSVDWNLETQNKPDNVCEIFSPREIRLLWGYDRYIDTSVFKRNDEIFDLRAFKMRTTINHELLFETPKEQWIERIQHLVYNEIKTRLTPLTHYRYVKFNNVPIIHPDGYKYYCAYAQGVNVNGRCWNWEELYGRSNKL